MDELDAAVSDNTLTTTRPSSRCIGFFDLPKELRIQIYDGYLSHLRSFKNPNQVMMTITNFPSTSLLRTCRQIKAELQEHIDFRSRLLILTRHIPNPKAAIKLMVSIRTIEQVEFTQHYGAVAKDEHFCPTMHDYKREVTASMDLINSLRAAMPQLKSISIIIIMLPPRQKAFDEVRSSGLMHDAIKEVKQIELRLGALGHTCPMRDMNKVLGLYKAGSYRDASTEKSQPRTSAWIVFSSLGRSLSM